MFSENKSSNVIVLSIYKLEQIFSSILLLLFPLLGMFYFWLIRYFYAWEILS